MQSLAATSATCKQHILPVRQDKLIRGTCDACCNTSACVCSESKCWSLAGSGLPWSQVCGHAIPLKCCTKLKHTHRHIQCTLACVDAQACHCNEDIAKYLDNLITLTNASFPGLRCCVVVAFSWSQVCRLKLLLNLTIVQAHSMHSH